MAYVWLTWLAAALRDEGCVVVEESGWAQRGRPSSTGQFNPYGVLWHHTGTTASASNPFPSRSVLINGRSDLPGPLCHVGIGYDGVCHVIAAGRANHAGECNGFGPFSSGDGNAQLVGFEIDYDGTQPMSQAQADAATRASAACLKRFGRDESYAARHAETSTTGKWDTGGVTGAMLRSWIGEYLATGGDMPLSVEDLQQVARYVWTSAGPQPAGTPAYAKTAVTDQFVQVDAALAALQSDVDALLERPPGGGDGSHMHAASSRAGVHRASSWEASSTGLALVAVLLAIVAVVVAIVRG